jgi:twitching motility two-component system response regulator PilH
LKSRILIVDDEPLISRLFALMLEDAGYAVETADNGATAVAKVRASRPDLVVLDVVMPVMDGFGVIEHLRHLPNTPPILLVTGSTDLVEARWPLPDCVAGFLGKPVRARELVTTCELALTPSHAVPSDVLERRRTPRRTLVSDVSVLSATGDPVLTGKLVKLSTMGAELQLEARFDAGQRLRILLPPATSRQPLVLEAQILYRSPLEGAFVYGLALAECPKTRERVRDLLGASA